MFLNQVAFDDRGIGHDLGAATFEDKGATFAANWISDTACAAQRNAAKIEWQTKPMIFRAISFDQLNLVSAAKPP